MLSVDELQGRIEALSCGEVLQIWRRDDLARRCVLYVERLADVVVPDVPEIVEPPAGPSAAWAAPVSAAADTRRFVVGVPAAFSSALTGFAADDATSPYPDALVRSCTGATSTAVLAAATATAAGITKWKHVAFAASETTQVRARIEEDARAEGVIAEVSDDGDAADRTVPVRCMVVRLEEFDATPLVRVEADIVASGAKAKVVEEADESVELGRLLRSKDGGVMHVQYVFADPAALRFAISAAVATARRLEPKLLTGKAETAILPAD